MGKWHVSPFDRGIAFAAWERRNAGIDGWGNCFLGSCLSIGASRPKNRSGQGKTEVSRRNINKFDLIISPSEFLRRVHNQSGVYPKNSLPSPGSGFVRVTPMVKHTKPKTLRIGYLGQIAPRKRVHLLLEAIEESSRFGCRSKNLRKYQPISSIFS